MRCPAGEARRAAVIRASWNHPATAALSRRSVFFRVQVGESTCRGTTLRPFGDARAQARRRERPAVRHVPRQHGLGLAERHG